MGIRTISQNDYSKSFEIHYKDILYKYNNLQYEIFLYQFFYQVNKFSVSISSELNVSSVLLIEKMKNKELEKVEKELLEILYNVTLKKEGDCNFT